jgi:hypothetical protein
LPKILESFVNVQLCSLFEKWPGHKTVTATILVVNDLVNALDTKMKWAALFVDLSKAFHTVDHAILLNMLSLSADAVSWLS